MTSAPSTAATGPPAGPVQQAAADQRVVADLTAHAHARLLILLRDRRPADRAEVAADVLQETLKRALQRAAEYSPDQGNPVGWLHGFLHRVLCEKCREIRKQPAQPAADPAAWDALAARLEPGASETTRRELDELLAELDPADREIVALHHLDGMSHAAIAGRLGISPAASRTRLARAMNVLREVAARKEGGR
jgi:RNA polymerase sigma factor (sigma-70 family)